jgi:hypothetical protein
VHKILLTGLLLIAVVFNLTGIAAETVSFDHPVLCTFRYSQYMDSKVAKTDTQKNTLEWTFFDLLSSNPYFISGGDKGSVLVYKHETSDGVSIMLVQGNGAHLFTLWPDGTAFWSKHNNIFGSKATQQFRGTCVNLRELN